jgi:hypothetical protein
MVAQNRAARAVQHKSLARSALVLACLGVTLSASACHDDDGAPSTPPPPSVTHCVDGAERALEATTLAALMSEYYDDCADLNTEAACRDAWHAAAHAPVDAQLGIVAEGCRKAYCPVLGSYAFDICKSDFVATPDSLARAWGPFGNAIVAREAGAYAQLVTAAQLTVYARSVQLKTEAHAAQVPSASAAPPAPSASSAATPPIGSGSPPVTSAAPSAASPPKAPSVASSGSPAAVVLATKKPAATKPAAKP